MTKTKASCSEQEVGQRSVNCGSGIRIVWKFMNPKTNEHYTTLEEPRSIYMAYVSLNSCSPADITEFIFAFLDDKDCDLNDAVLWWDRDEYRTYSGLLGCIEQHIGNDIYRLVCFLHAYEILLRQIISKLDGKPKCS